MIKKLEQLGIKNILVADDRVENILAAKQYFGQFRGISTSYLNSGREAVAEIKRNYKEIGLVLTDLEMETPYAGVNVALTGYEYLIPSYIITGGPQHRGTNPTIKIIPEGTGFEGTKEDPKTWERCLESLINLSGSSISILNAILRAKRAGIGVPLEDIREVAKYLINGEARSAR